MSFRHSQSVPPYTEIGILFPDPYCHTFVRSDESRGRLAWQKRMASNLLAADKKRIPSSENAYAGGPLRHIALYGREGIASSMSPLAPSSVIDSLMELYQDLLGTEAMKTDTKEGTKNLMDECRICTTPNSFKNQICTVAEALDLVRRASLVCHANSKAFLFTDFVQTVPCNPSSVGCIRSHIFPLDGSESRTNMSSAKLSLQTTAAGINQGDLIRLSYPDAQDLSNDELMLRYGVSFLGNRREIVCIEKQPFRRALLANRTPVPDEMYPFLQDDIATFIRDTKHKDEGCRHSVPGPNITDVATLRLARWCVVYIPWLGEANKYHESLLGSRTGFEQYNYPLPFELELTAWSLLAQVCETTLSNLAPLEHDKIALSNRKSGIDFLITYRMDKKELLQSTYNILQRCIQLSQKEGRLVLDPNISDPLGHLCTMSNLERDLLINRMKPTKISPTQLLKSLLLSEDDYVKASQGCRMKVKTAVLCIPNLLNTNQCKALRDAVDAIAQNQHCTGKMKYQSLGGTSILIIDNEDAKLNACRLLKDSTLQKLRHAAWRLLQLQMNTHTINLDEYKCMFEAPSVMASKDMEILTSISTCQPRVFVRRSQTNTNPNFNSFVPFHCESASITIHVSLNDGNVGGGEMLALVGDRLRQIDSQGSGQATVYANNLLHGFRQVTFGVQYSLIAQFK